MEDGEVLFSDDDLKESFGDYLKRHREASGKTLDGIARTTRISKRYLQAFEDNLSQNLPEDAFARGFLKAYAKEVGLDVDDCILRYDRFRRSLMPTQIKDIRKPPKMTSLGGEGFEPLQNQKWVVWGLMTGVIIAGVVAGVLLLIQWFQHSTPSVSKQAPSEQVAEGTDTNIAEAPPVNPPVPTEQIPAKPTVEAQAPQMATPVKPSTLTIKANRDGKLTLRIDENALQDVSLKAGETQTVNVFKEVEIRNTDRAAFSFQYNGKPLDISGPVIKLFNRHLYTKKQ
ncbi:MAG: helix-turn-helix domain protein [Bacteriovoracaceae bacterium]|nr:helix-turn-helix domain protein [Bacteriovoracaceae bacterium]